MMETIVLPAQDHLAHERCRAMSRLMYPVDRVPRSAARRRGNATPAAIETTSHFMLRTRTGGDIPLNVGDVQKAVQKHSERVEKWTSTDRKRPSDRKKSHQGGAPAPIAIARTRSGEEIPLAGQQINIRKKPPRHLEELAQTPAQAQPPFVSLDRQQQARSAETTRVATSGSGNSHSHHHKKVIKKKISNEHAGNALIRTRSPDSTDSDEGKSSKEKNGESATLSHCASVLAGLTSPPSELGLALTPPKPTSIDAAATTLYGQIDSSISSFHSHVGRRGVPGRGRLLGRTGSLTTEGERHGFEKGRASVSRSDSAGAVEFFGSTPPRGSERWAGPGFTNSPPPSTLPLPTFPFRLKSGAMAADLSMENLTRSDSTPSSAFSKIVPLFATSGMLGGSVDPSSATKQLRKLLNLDEELKNVEPEFKMPALAKRFEEELQSLSKKEGLEDLKSVATVVYDDVKALMEVEEVMNNNNSVATWQLKKMLQL